MLNILEKTKKEYSELRKEYTAEELNLFFGGFHGLMEIIKQGALSDLYKWLNQPAEDWQRDC